MKNKLLLIFLMVYAIAFSQNVALKTGDIIFQSMNCGPLCDAINQVTEGYKGNDFSHLGLVYTQNDSIYIIEAAGNAVQLTSLEKFKSYTNEPMFVGRLKSKYKKHIPDAIAFSLKQIGIPYDEAYLYNNGSYYCSELIYDAFLDAYNKPFFELQPMTFKGPNSNEYFEVWQEYYAKLNIKIPEGELGCNPGGISLSKKLRIIGTLN